MGQYMKGSNGRANACANAVEPSASQRGMQSSLHAQPFIPDLGPSSSSPSPQSNVRGSNLYSLTNSAGTTFGGANSSSTKLSLAAVNAAPFVPGSTLQDQAAPRSFAASGFGQRELPQSKPSLFGGTGRGYLGQAQAAAWALPDGDDLLGLTAHTPGQPLQPPATPVQDGRLDRAAADTANIQSPARAYNSSYQEQQAAGGRGRGSSARGRQAASSSPARVAAPSPDRASPMYGRGIGRGAAQRRGFVGGSDNGIAYGMPAGQAQQMQMQYMRDQLRQELQQRSFLSHVQAERRPEEFGLPDMVQQYHSLFPLEDLQAAAEQPSAAFGVCTALLRAASPLLQGQAVTLRRMDPRQVAPSQAVVMSGQEAVETWRPLAHHPGLICPRAAFVSDEVGGRPSLFFVHDHMPGAVTLEQAHMQPQSGPAGLQRAPAAEQQMWTYLTQLTAALRAVHAAGCAVGASGLAPSKALLASFIP
ncbi:TPA: PAB-dependent poly(A)-specific ribonuclease subunit 3, variant 2 [Trebouxia sp. C0004]